ncbi:hypothetical protein HMPREF1705_04745 [Acetomicrobium hydrogeniformans ATCC BAA-1850]|uniref:Uncharacterized protein n=1 Tax=Acetomicrobium hydrogeniformans ATCC BAA-1850 TaxID=592015 RepID=A0A0T5X7Z0_9BACT|nr:hypothetical protein HMPREF1705_04745 [Acetomicrobium hydrogeniformans ATCC BAA-1850]
MFKGCPQRWPFDGKIRGFLGLPFKVKVQAGGVYRQSEVCLQFTSGSLRALHNVRQTWEKPGLPGRRRPQGL